MQRSEAETRPHLVLEVDQPHPHPLSQSQVNARARRHHKVVPIPVSVRNLKSPSAREKLNPGHESLGMKRPARPREQSQLTLTEVGIHHPARFGLDAPPPLQVRIDIHASARNTPPRSEERRAGKECRS